MENSKKTSAFSISNTLFNKFLTLKDNINEKLQAFLRRPQRRRAD